MAKKPGAFEASRGAERRFAIELRKVARIVGGMIRAHIDGPTVRDMPRLLEALARYSVALGPWADKTAARFIEDIARGNKKAWAKQSGTIARELKNEMSGSIIGATVKLLQDRQTALIKSLPIEAGERAQRLALEGAMQSRRASEIAEELAASEEVTVNRATLIARTEISKANAAITQARAEYAGVTHYVWRTAGDGDVRESHREMDGTVHRFDDPPTLSDGMTGNPGEFPNCRCFAEPVIPEYDENVD